MHAVKAAVQLKHEVMLNKLSPTIFKYENEYGRCGGGSIIRASLRDPLREEGSEVTLQNRLLRSPNAKLEFLA